MADRVGAGYNPFADQPDPHERIRATVANGTAEHVKAVMAELDGRPAESTILTESALAHLFTARYYDRLRYIAVWNRWHDWTGHGWALDATLHVFDRARALCEGESRRAGVPIKRVESAAMVAAVVRLASADRAHAATADQWNVDPWLLNTPPTTAALKLRKEE